MSSCVMGPGTSAAPQRLLALVADGVAGVIGRTTHSALAACQVRFTDSIVELS